MRTSGCTGEWRDTQVVVTLPSEVRDACGVTLLPGECGETQERSGCTDPPVTATLPVGVVLHY